MVGESLLGQSALQAFRADQPIGGAQPDGDDEAAILVATLLRQHLVLAREDPAATRIRAHAITLATDSLGPAALEEGCTYDDHPSRSDIDIVRRLAQRTEQAGWMRLALHLLESAAEMAVEKVDRGRILSDRARNSRKLGQLDLCEAQADELKRIGLRASNGELIALAHDHLAATAQVRGNFVAFKAHLAEVVRAAARAKHSRLLASGYNGLGVHAGLSGDYSNAVGHLWASYRQAQGGPLQLRPLGNLAHTLMLSGRPTEARKIAKLMVAASPPQQLLIPVLGVYAVASARLGDAADVDWACARVKTLAKGRHHQREIAEALVECSAALEIVGRHAQAGVLRRRAEGLAASNGFHDLTFAEVLTAVHGVPPERSAFKGAGARAEREIGELALPRVPALATTSS